MGMVQDESRDLGNCLQLGFTLLEVLVAVLILSLAYVAVLQNFSQSSANILRLEKGRVTDIHDTMALEQQLRGESLAGEVVVQGEKFVLKKIAIHDGRGETLKLEKRR